MLPLAQTAAQVQSYDCHWSEYAALQSIDIGQHCNYKLRIFCLFRMFEGRLCNSKCFIFFILFWSWTIYLTNAEIRKLICENKKTIEAKYKNYWNKTHTIEIMKLMIVYCALYNNQITLVKFNKKIRTRGKRDRQDR